MAKRRRLETPSADALRELEEGFARETTQGPLGPLPPIAQVAADAAAQSTPGDAGQRVEAARNATDADRLRHAIAAGLLVLEIPVSQVVAEELSRDRLDVDTEEMTELKTSIAAHGLRLPIEVFELPGAEEGERFGLISGWRRLSAVRALLAETGQDKYRSIKAIVVAPKNVTDAYVAMVEENEIRSDLSHYERGRITVMSVGQGAFDSVEAAVAGLFHAASKAKRSKIRSFALIHEELGDMLSFPTRLSERAGLRLAGALRAGFEGELRTRLAAGQGTDAESEWALMEPVIAAVENPEGQTPRRGGPRKGAVPRRRDAEGEIRLGNGISIHREVDDRGYSIRFTGAVVSVDLIDTVMAEIQRLLEPI
ncbi:ParB/RepB/Spo0J family partition protein [Pseudogemmobacter sp. W21_MBD1_M6]|uniref:ParB/RepB/Spo0J family partition protein n=1 Tax=Pseudogemmobacter sp. W21_MBD1_M6 TaxID=3240271 RepID=UPI003F9806DA